MAMQHLHTMQEVDSISAVTTKYIPCPECGGSGDQLIARLYPSGHKECWETCEFCDGEGQFEEDDYLVMKLEGKV